MDGSIKEPREWGLTHLVDYGLARISSNSANTEEWFYIDEPEKGWIRYQDPSSLWFWWHNESLGLCELILLQSIANLIDVLKDPATGNVYYYSSVLVTWTKPADFIERVIWSTMASCSAKLSCQNSAVEPEQACTQRHHGNNAKG